ncbi:MAG: hypothetical protein KatS3mg102_2548 [Planctomycetota bacterium]|nr:MAG: hypothetical protein KatS3mg102_2548 [Planctomycetota bacterium]
MPEAAAGTSPGPVRERRAGPWRLCWDAAQLPAALCGRLERLGELFSDPRAVRYNLCHTAETIRWDEPEAGALFVKRYRTRNRLDGLKNRFRRSRARKAWEAGRRLAALGVATGLPLALAERRRGLRLEEAYLVTRAVPHAGNVLEWFRDHARSRPRLRACFVRALARHLRALHERGIDLRDLKGTNVLVCAPAPPAGAEQPWSPLWQFAHIDLDRAAFDRRLRERDRIRALVYLDASYAGLASRADRLRFLLAYLGPGEAADRARVRRMARAIERGTAERLRRRRPPLTS